MKIHRALLVPVLVTLLFVLPSTDATSQVTRRRLGCKDSFNYALLYYNKGQFERAKNYLTECMEEMERDRARYSDDYSLRPLVFKVYKIVILSLRNLDEEKLANKKMNDLVRIFYNQLDRKAVEKQFAETELTEIRK